jgi:hypothetical protein
MAETEIPTPGAAENAAAPAPGARSKDDVALELMKFIAVATGYGRGPQSSAGFSGKPSTRTAEEHTDALLELFERCRRAVNKEI